MIPASTPALSRRMLFCGPALVALLFVTSTAKVMETQSAGKSDGCGHDHAHQRFTGFIENEGQWNATSRFVGVIGDLVVRAEPGAIVAQRESRQGTDRRLGVVRLVFEGSKAVEPQAGDRSPAEFNYFVGRDSNGWRRHVPSYADVTYPGVCAGTDLVLHERDGRLEYDLRLSPDSDVKDFVVRCEGVDGMAIEANGDLRMDTPLGPLVQHAPTAWQLAPGDQRTSVDCALRILDPRHFGLAVSDRTPGSSLVIDPGLTWATYLGGAGQDWARSVRTLADGSILVLGRTESPDFPTTAGVFDQVPDAFDMSLTCFEPTGSQLVFSTVVGGTSAEWPQALAIAPDGRIGIGGWSNSTDYPVLPSSYDGTFHGGNYDACVSVLAPDGADLAFSTLIGGAGLDEVDGMAFTSAGQIVIAGKTGSSDFPTTAAALDRTFGGQTDGFVAWFDPNQFGLAQLVRCTFLGSSKLDEIHDLTLGPGDEPIVVGETNSPDFPTTPGAYDETPATDFVGFLTRIAADGSSLVASTHFKGGEPTQVTTDGDTILCAGYNQLDFPASPTAYDKTPNGFHDCFVARFDGDLGHIGAATLLGGSNNDDPDGLEVAEDGNVIVVGATQSPDYPTTPGAFDTVFGGSPPGSTSMVSRISADLSQLLYSSYLGPVLATASSARSVAALGGSDVVIVGAGAGSGFPVTPGSFDDTFNGGPFGDGYVVRMTLATTWASLSGALAGSSGLPQLSGNGDLSAGTPVILTLRHAKPKALAALVIGLTLIDAPVKGGLLVPAPDIELLGLPIDSQGLLVLNSTWPTGLPSGFEFFAQCWIPDPAGPKGFAASNGLLGTTP